ncbi:MAG TPA: MFS transporter, partial [Edaphobacter sp.]|nr:MFS transporter [Edaphobacter sp.]
VVYPRACRARIHRACAGSLTVGLASIIDDNQTTLYLSMQTTRENVYQNTTIFSDWCRLWPLFTLTAAWGLVTVMLGPLLPALVARWKILDSQAGTLFTASFIGQLIGAWFATRNLRLSLAAGAGLTVAGLVGLAWVGFPLAHVALFAIGIGLSAGLTAGNVIAGLSSLQRARSLALFNVSWSAGAIACPAIVRFASAGDTRLFFLSTAAIVAVCGGLATLLPRSLTRPASPTPNSLYTHARLPLRLVLLFGICMVIYIGVENAIGGWLPSFAARSNPDTKPSTIAMLYWLSELISRLLMALLLVRMSERVLYRASLALLLSSVAFLVLIPHLAPSMLWGAAITCGASIGPVYPLLIAFLLDRFAGHPWVGRLFALASIGGAFLPWLTGVVSTHFGGLRAGLIVPVAGILSMLLLSHTIGHPRSSAPAPKV